MPKLLLKFHASPIREIPLDKMPLTIGRKNDNDIVIDTMPVSGHHARIIRVGSAYVIEDLQSTNGTFLNEKRILSAVLRDSDAVTVGEHTILFDEYGEPARPAAKPAAPPPAAEPEAPLRLAPPPAEPSGVLRVIEGKSDRTEYPLTGLLTYIGKSESAAVRIRGLFTPAIAALISKRPSGFLFTAVKEGYPRLNGKPHSGQAELKDGDIIEAGGVKFMFQLKDVKKEG